GHGARQPEVARLAPAAQLRPQGQERAAQEQVHEQDVRQEGQHQDGGERDGRQGEGQGDVPQQGFGLGHEEYGGEDSHGHTPFRGAAGTGAGSRRDGLTATPASWAPGGGSGRRSTAWT